VPRRRRKRRSNTAKTPDLKVLQGSELLLDGHGLTALCGTALETWIVFGHEPEDDGHGCENNSVDLGGHFPAKGHHQERGPEVGDSGTHVAGAKNTQRRALVLPVVPFGGVGNADDEGAAGKPDAQGRDQEEAIGCDG